MRQKRFSVLILAVVLLCGITIGAGAATTVQTITATLDPTVSVKYNNEVQNLLDANGNRVYPISYQGTTYLPIRAISNLLDLGVSWDQATRSVLLGDPEEGVDLIEAFKPYTKYNTDGNDQFVQNSDKMSANAGGVEISHWIGFKYHGWTDRQRTTSFNLGGKYTSLTFRVYADVDTTLTLKGDNDHVLGEYNLVGGQVPQTITVNLLNTTQLSFVRDGKEYSMCYIFDTVLK
ncbi:hypothetical protein D1159_06850 [Pseudoflavonifractor sp. 524-17]|uniref:stalk domain-containing protein n=1 Tax=Pseudoflavonifractor sp. 524-17 TaxID=2304577 RepID=UPI00137AC6F4|nr:stalk domain-containing protein [Pseudoflavonifractor sp. 524-17]NCE64311.1 hypothetical protein [Pseudoflavonifractor sp. 524-17]